MTLAIALGDKRKLAALLNNRGDLAMSRDEWATAVRHFGDAMRLNQEIGNRYGEMVVLLNLSEVFLHTGDFAQAEAHVCQLLAMPEAAAAPFLALAQSHLAEALFQQKRLAEAAAAVLRDG